MIEIVCNEGKGGGNENGPQNFKRPKNIKQIGSMGSDKKIYIEDYVFTYINALSYEDADRLKAGVLLGASQKSEEDSCLFIKGAVKIRPEQQQSHITFDENVWAGIYEDMEKYFPELEIVGWFLATPDVTKEVMSSLTKMHIDNFAGNMKALYLINKIEKEENFYLYENNELKKQCGYICFYERNSEMQEYMLADRGEKRIEPVIQEEVIQNFREIVREKREVTAQKKNISFMYGVSTFMIVVVLVIGINMMNSYEKMQNFDLTLNEIVAEIANMNGKSGQDSINVSGTVGEKETDGTPVNKVDGDVYPTEAPTQQVNDPPEPPTETEAAAPVSSTYTVQKGDTLLSICRRTYGDTQRLEEVMIANSLDDPNKIYVGQEIKLP